MTSPVPINGIEILFSEESLGSQDDPPHDPVPSEDHLGNATFKRKFESSLLESIPCEYEREEKKKILRRSLRLSKDEKTCLSPAIEIPGKVKPERSFIEPQSFSLHSVTVPDSCSLFNSVKLSWRITCPGDIDSSQCHFVHISELQNKTKNGIWLKLNPKPTEFLSSEFLLHIQLFERHTNAQRVDVPVQFCRGKCSQRRQQIIDLQESRLPSISGNLFEATIAINEQCAHRADNDYGSPNVRFYFRMQMWEKNGEMSPRLVTSVQSPLVKVVAPGKSKQGKGNKKLAKGSTGKMTTKQMMEAFLLTMQSMNERLTQLEHRMNQLPQESIPPPLKEELNSLSAFQSPFTQMPFSEDSLSNFSAEDILCLADFPDVQ